MTEISNSAGKTKRLAKPVLLETKGIFESSDADNFISTLSERQLDIIKRYSWIFNMPIHPEIAHAGGENKE